ncbi:class I SAM-dependent methyltransferase [Mesorhizobium sp. M7A.F.Ca.CA.001.07.2.1]|uniref:class I SAM-dependent methyltransferase n=10 Tax=Phyllobacteriaceae TaxID=69277 RepID=UPI000FCB0F85|nr:MULTISPECIES: class I SAM-dependent methyltransferase [Mesorhizobium]RVB43153.1 class I SAM-dependent methyltransferase [Mesorhizobium sp. M7A.F.Ca.CA.004.05.1.1]MCF6123104.1 class I SAM-dependent methyltransferase [Mesorhizobium ciceri]MCQ8816966.1 class I SAM-dependent methyltransferase [Mesorhizobium sp. SEMIA396]RUX69533.1 class I SAM-dependent methyltransferase [Mesorhizobium sp. M7A.F.Ca.CA.004.08.2.1]RUX88100.1 class I SAM-dependent methyltransferase [Mesorhizobium sp. M7A.F.Ca.CA.00
MTRLKTRIVDLIEALGPIPINEYMAMCLFDPADGYYTTREPFGAAGDFITAPEISQMFGELVAVWMYQAWQASGRPLPATIAEIGPGRGTLMKDMLRTLSRLDPDLASGATFAMIETSPRLTEVQKQTLGATPFAVGWHETIETLPQQPLFIVGNELFDAVPIRQFLRAGAGWRERVVGLDETNDLCFFAGAGSVDPTLLPADATQAPQGSIAEVAPARTALMATIAERISRHGGAGLFIDYGHLQPGVGDTLQALRSHDHEDVLANPGEADLTSHVDFAALAAIVRAHGLEAHLTTQGDFLLGMGILERAGRLGADAGQAARERIAGDVERLAGPQAMGELFKVLAVLPRGVAVRPFAGAD